MSSEWAYIHTHTQRRLMRWECGGGDGMIGLISISKCFPLHHNENPLLSRMNGTSSKRNHIFISIFIRSVKNNHTIFFFYCTEQTARWINTILFRCNLLLYRTVCVSHAQIWTISQCNEFVALATALKFQTFDLLKIFVSNIFSAMPKCQNKMTST